MPNTQAPILDVPDNGGEFAADNGQHQAPILDVPDNGGEFAADNGQHPASLLAVPDNGGEFAADNGQHPASLLTVPDNGGEFAVDSGQHQAPILDVPDNGGEFAVDSGQHPAPILEVRDLEVEFAVDDGKIKVLDGVSFKVAPGQTLGVVGESGCGKSVTSLAIMGLLPKPHGQVVAGSIRFQGEELLSLAPDQMYKVRGNRISMIFQEPMTALNPVQTVGEQLMEVFRLHRPEYDKAQRKAAAIAMLQKVGIPEPAQRFAVYPYNLSGGMRQRVMIAMALSCEPDLLICDEPTTALDVTIQAQILELMKELQAQTGMAIIFITHDLGVVAELCDEVVVMYAGRAVEQADVFELFDHPRHPYTHGLMSSIPRLEDEPKSLLKTIKGQVPALHEMPAGCRFSNRCPHATDLCVSAVPAVEQLTSRHHVACHYWKELTV